ncbi:hypothetical protein IWX84_002499 [Flavobacterium sp. CG_9.10]|nr:hypothetical protein [Flavobacterium sp. CG_9.10]MBG6111612.1 hypothetical protein [Flavobacterium sp. CG_9.10]
MEKSDKEAQLVSRSYCKVGKIMPKTNRDEEVLISENKFENETS